MKLWESRPMPERERRWLTGVTGTVWAGVLAWNVSHVQEHLAQHLIHGWRMWALSFAPDILILIGVWKLRYRSADVIGWLMAHVGVAWLSWAALSTTEATASGRLFAMAPIGTVVLMTLALEFEESRPTPEPSPSPVSDRPTRTRTTRTITPRLPAPVADATPAEPPRLVADPAPWVSASLVPAQDGERPARPSRERAREILLGLDDLEAVSCGYLHRTYGGSDRWWVDQKRSLRAELAQMETEVLTST